VIEVHIAPLAERRDDVLPLAEHFLADRAVLGDAARAALLVHAWPGNVRELKNAIERAALLAGGDLVTPALLGLQPSEHTAAPRNLDEPQREAIVAALARADGVVSRAAQSLGLSRQALYRRMERYGLVAAS
jgi:DNA-binding NtrC family response regulator